MSNDEANDKMQAYLQLYQNFNKRKRVDDDGNDEVNNNNNDARQHNLENNIDPPVNDNEQDNGAVEEDETTTLQNNNPDEDLMFLDEENVNVNAQRQTATNKQGSDMILDKVDDLKREVTILKQKLDNIVAQENNNAPGVDVGVGPDNAEDGIGAGGRSRTRRSDNTTGDGNREDNAVAPSGTYR